MNIKKLPAFGIAAVLLGFEEAQCMKSQPASSKSLSDLPTVDYATPTTASNDSDRYQTLSDLTTTRPNSGDTSTKSAASVHDDTSKSLSDLTTADSLTPTLSGRAPSAVPDSPVGNSDSSGPPVGNTSSALSEESATSGDDNVPGRSEPKKSRNRSTKCKGHTRCP
eukprot:GHVS01078730.1.p1 GENE.GHVS01078730.1~~GHVS01078730.1.p1  ORF type:complete len:166 (-),score=13.98 GHVS01078730.1:403-900(-)